jgi:ketosteroid isomerase-like protein
MSDEEAIRNLMADYCQLVDDERFDAFAELFTDDAVVTAKLAGTTYRGPDEIRGFLERQPPHKRGLHVTVNHHIEVDGDAARASADFFVVVSRPEGLHLLGMGRYDDELVRQGGRWKFKVRHVNTRYAEM